MTGVHQPAPDDTITVRRITHFPEEVLTLSPIDALALQVQPSTSRAAFADVRSRTASTTDTPVGLFLAAAAAF